MATCRQIDADAYRNIHKGIPFYWLGTAAFLVHDYQTATFFFDAAVSEDIRIGADPVNKSSPALRFIQVEGDQPQQAAKPLVIAMQSRIEDAIADYNRRPGRPAGLGDLELIQVRENFLRIAVSKGKEGWRSLATALISYFLEWDYRSTLSSFEQVMERQNRSSFTYSRAVSFSKAFSKPIPKDTPPSGASTLGAVLKYLCPRLGIPPNIGIGNTDFPSVLSDLSSANDSILTALQFAGRVRNTVGHNLGWRQP